MHFNGKSAKNKSPTDTLVSYRYSSVYIGVKVWFYFVTNTSVSIGNCGDTHETQTLFLYNRASRPQPVDFCRVCRVWNINKSVRKKTQSEMFDCSCSSSDSQDGFPIRIKAVNIINEPRIFKGIFAIIKPFLKEKMAERVTILLLSTACVSE